VFELAHELWIFGETTETPSMVSHSVDTMIGCGYHHCNHLALGFREF